MRQYSPSFTHPAFATTNPQHGPLRQGEEWKLRHPTTGRDQTGRYTNLYFLLIRRALPENLNGLPIRVGESKPLECRHIRVRRRSSHDHRGVNVVLSHQNGSLPIDEYGFLIAEHVGNLHEYQRWLPNAGGGIGAVRDYPEIAGIQVAVARAARVSVAELLQQIEAEKDTGIPAHWWPAE